VRTPPSPYQAHAWYSLGGNRGDVEAALAGARAALRALSAGPLVCSPLYMSEAWGGVTQAPFLNQVVGGVPRLGPAEMLHALQAVEREWGRDRAQEDRWGSRTLDVDLLSWPRRTVDTAALTLPHPRLAQRRFVLAPWTDAAPGVVPFGLERAVAELLGACPDSSWVRRCSR
jgi:2-amino-4-hydroxy-6-hydroxymethyldihydropteridine diphosphokinase